MSEPNTPETPPDVGVAQALGAAGASPEVLHKSQTWFVGWPIQAAKTVLEQLVVQVAEANLEELRGAMPQQRFARKEKELDDQLFGGHWKTWGSLWSTVVNGPDGMALFLLALLREKHPQATLAQARELWRDANRQVRRALTTVVPGFFDLLAESLPADSADRAKAALQMRREVLELLEQPTPSD